MERSARKALGALDFYGLEFRVFWPFIMYDLALLQAVGGLA